MQNYWEGIYGQTSVINILTKLIDNSKIPHALLFTGSDGVGKEFTAIRFAQALNAKFSATDESEKANNLISRYTEPYIKYITPLPRGKNETESNGPFEKLSSEENELFHSQLSEKIKNPYFKIQIPKANQIKISSIRDINKFLSFNFSDVSHRIVLISDAHLMNEAAQNALLKNLEEPPEGIIFILSTQYPNLLRETIRSRCWSLPFQPLKDEDVKDILINHFNIDSQLAWEVAGFSGGSVRTALKLLEQEFEKLRDKTIIILRYSFGRKYNSALSEFQELVSNNSAETLKLIIQMIITWLTDVQKYRFESGDYYFTKHIETLEKFNARFPDLELREIIFKLDRLATVIHNNVNINTIMFNIVFELAMLTIPKKPQKL